jgi:hypothetical protein
MFRAGRFGALPIAGTLTMVGFEHTIPFRSPITSIRASWAFDRYE